MPHIPQGSGVKGSQKWIQKLIKEKPDLLNSLIRFTYRQSRYPAHLDCEINLLELFTTEGERQKFDNKYASFLDINTDNCCIYDLKGDSLCYTTEQLIPTKANERPPLLLINGARHK